jgi:hypothetical protein
MSTDECSNILIYNLLKVILQHKVHRRYGIPINTSAKLRWASFTYSVPSSYRKIKNLL